MPLKSIKVRLLLRFQSVDGSSNLSKYDIGAYKAANAD